MRKVKNLLALFGLTAGLLAPAAAKADTVSYDTRTIEIDGEEIQADFAIDQNNQDISWPNFDYYFNPETKFPVDTEDKANSTKVVTNYVITNVATGQKFSGASSQEPLNQYTENGRYKSHLYANVGKMPAGEYHVELTVSLLIPAPKDDDPGFRETKSVNYDFDINKTQALTLPYVDIAYTITPAKDASMFKYKFDARGITGCTDIKYSIFFDSTDNTRDLTYDNLDSEGEIKIDLTKGNITYYLKPSMTCKNAEGNVISTNANTYDKPENFKAADIQQVDASAEITWNLTPNDNEKFVMMNYVIKVALPEGTDAHVTNYAVNFHKAQQSEPTYTITENSENVELAGALKVEIPDGSNQLTMWMKGKVTLSNGQTINITPYDRAIDFKLTGGDVNQNGTAKVTYNGEHSDTETLNGNVALNGTIVLTNPDNLEIKSIRLAAVAAPGDANDGVEYETWPYGNKTDIVIGEATLTPSVEDDDVYLFHIILPKERLKTGNLAIYMKSEITLADGTVYESGGIGAWNIDPSNYHQVNIKFELQDNSGNNLVIPADRLMVEGFHVEDFLFAENPSWENSEVTLKNMKVKISDTDNVKSITLVVLRNGTEEVGRQVIEAADGTYEINIEMTNLTGVANETDIRPYHNNIALKAIVEPEEGTTQTYNLHPSHWTIDTTTERIHHERRAPKTLVAQGVIYPWADPAVEPTDDERKELNDCDNGLMHYTYWNSQSAGIARDPEEGQEAQAEFFNHHLEWEAWEFENGRVRFIMTIFSDLLGGALPNDLITYITVPASDHQIPITTYRATPVKEGWAPAAKPSNTPEAAALDDKDYSQAKVYQFETIKPVEVGEDRNFGFQYNFQYRSGGTVISKPFTVKLEEPVPSGIEDVEIDNSADAPVEFYNLQGVRVDNPAAGLYIRRQGTKVEKVVIR